MSRVFIPTDGWFAVPLSVLTTALCNITTFSRANSSSVSQTPNWIPAQHETFSWVVCLQKKKKKRHKHISSNGNYHNAEEL